VTDFLSHTGPSIEKVEDLIVNGVDSVTQFRQRFLVAVSHIHPTP